VSSRHRSVERYAAALILFVLVTVIWFHGVVLHPESRVECCISDGTSTIRDYWAASVQHRNPFTFTHDALSGAPEGTARTPATLLAAGGIQTAVVWGLHGLLGLVGAWNAFLFFGLIATAVATFALLERLGCNFIASLYGGYVFAFSPYVFERAYAGHLGLMQDWVFVLVVAAMLRLRRHRTLASAALVGLTIALAFYNSAYEGLLAAVVAGAFFLADLARLPSGRGRLGTLLLGATTYIATALALIPVFVLYSRERALVASSTSHTTSDFYTYAARMSAYFVPSPRNPLFHSLRRFHPADLTEQTLYFGYTTWLLALCCVVMLIRHNSWLTASPRRMWTAISMALLAPIAFFMSLPPTYHEGRFYIITGSAPLALFTSFWRVYSRFGLIVGFALTTLSAFALSAFAERPRRIWRLVAPVALVLVFLELLPGNVGTFNAVARPPWIAWLAHQPRGIVATYPLPYKQRAGMALAQEDYWYQQFDGDPLFAVIGTSFAQAQTRDQAIRLLASDIGDPLTAGVLASEGVRYVIVHDDVYAAESKPAPHLNPRRFVLLRRFGQVRVFGLHAPRTNVALALRARAGEIASLEEIAAPMLSFTSGFSAPLRYGSLTGRWLGRRGALVVSGDGEAAYGRLVAKTLSNSQPYVIQLEDASGRVRARELVPAHAVRIQLGPFPIVPSTNAALTLVVASVAGAPRSAVAAPGMIFLAGLAVRPLEFYAPLPHV
jgi:hypothetical protein